MPIWPALAPSPPWGSSSSLPPGVQPSPATQAGTGQVLPRRRKPPRRGEQRTPICSGPPTWERKAKTPGQPLPHPVPPGMGASDDSGGGKQPPSPSLHRGCSRATPTSAFPHDSRRPWKETRMRGCLSTPGASGGAGGSRRPGRDTHLQSGGPLLIRGHLQEVVNVHLIRHLCFLQQEQVVGGPSPFKGQAQRRRSQPCPPCPELEVQASPLPPSAAEGPFLSLPLLGPSCLCLLPPLPSQRGRFQVGLCLLAVSSFSLEVLPEKERQRGPWDLLPLRAVPLFCAPWARRGFAGREGWVGRRAHRIMP